MSLHAQRCMKKRVWGTLFFSILMCGVGKSMANKQPVDPYCSSAIKEKKIRHYKISLVVLTSFLQTEPLL